jgi:hypothetical protein
LALASITLVLILILLDTKLYLKKLLLKLQYLCFHLYIPCNFFFVFGLHQTYLNSETIRLSFELGYLLPLLSNDSILFCELLPHWDIRLEGFQLLGGAKFREQGLSENLSARILMESAWGSQIVTLI